MTWKYEVWYLYLRRGGKEPENLYDHYHIFTNMLHFEVKIKLNKWRYMENAEKMKHY